MHTKSKATYVALPSRKNTQLMVSSRSAAVILRETGFRLIVKLCCVDSMLAYLRILILALASTRFLPSGVICKEYKKQILDLHKKRMTYKNCANA